jgi:threonyl-tRNA synthetase
MQKIPYMLVVGDNEITEKAVNVRKYGEQKSETVSFDQFLQDIKQEVIR